MYLTCTLNCFPKFLSKLCDKKSIDSSSIQQQSFSTSSLGKVPLLSGQNCTIMSPATQSRKPFELVIHLKLTSSQSHFNSAAFIFWIPLYVDVTRSTCFFFWKKYNSTYFLLTVVNKNRAFFLFSIFFSTSICAISLGYHGFPLLHQPITHVWCSLFLLSVIQTCNN